MVVINTKTGGYLPTKVAEIFALLAMVGDLACKFNVFTHRSNELVDLISGLFKEWLKDRGSTQSMEEKNVLDCLINSLEANKNRFDHRRWNI